MTLFHKDPRSFGASFFPGGGEKRVVVLLRPSLCALLQPSFFFLRGQAGLVRDEGAVTSVFYHEISGDHFSTLETTQMENKKWPYAGGQPPLSVLVSEKDTYFPKPENRNCGI